MWLCMLPSPQLLVWGFGLLLYSAASRPRHQQAWPSPVVGIARCLPVTFLRVSYQVSCSLWKIFKCFHSLIHLIPPCLIRWDVFALFALTPCKISVLRTPNHLASWLFSVQGKTWLQNTLSTVLHCKCFSGRLENKCCTSWDLTHLSSLAGLHKQRIGEKDHLGAPILVETCQPINLKIRRAHPISFDAQMAYQFLQLNGATNGYT